MDARQGVVEIVAFFLYSSMEKSWVMGAVISADSAFRASRMSLQRRDALAQGLLVQP